MSVTHRSQRNPLQRTMAPVLVLAGVLAVCRQPAAAQAPHIVFDDTTLDLGVVYEDSPTSFSFPFGNEGGKALHIRKVEKSCGCTSATTSRRVLDPGEMARIRGVLDPRSMSGKQKRGIIVFSDGPVSPQVYLMIQATVVSPYIVLPRRVAFSDLIPTSSTTQYVRVQNQTGRAIRFLNVDSTSPFIEVRPLDSKLHFIKRRSDEAIVTLSVSKSILLGVTVTSPRNVQWVQGVVRIQTDFSPKPEILVPVVGNVIRDLKVVPRDLYFGVVKRNQSAEKSFQVASRSGRPFQIASIEVGDLPVTIKAVELRGRAGYRVVVNLNQGLKPQNVFGKIILRTTHPNGHTVEIPMFANLR